jgi:hypothetical protein
MFPPQIAGRILQATVTPPMATVIQALQATDDASPSGDTDAARTFEPAFNRLQILVKP